MESIIIKSDQKNYAPSPFTERSYASSISVSSDGKWMGYCVGNVVVVRSLVDLKTCKIYTEHKVKTSAVGFSTNNVFVTSGDIEGNLKIWFLDDMSLKKEFNKALGSKINGIEWNDESNKIFLYGEGKLAFGRCINWETGSNIGEISSHSKLILSGDMRKIRPYRIATGSEDYGVNFYEGTPFKILKMNKEHTNFVTGVKFSPDSSKFVSVGFDKRIVLYDGKDGSVLFTLAQDKAIDNHTMAIIGVCWIDNHTIATGSLDRTVKVWDINDKVCKYTLYPKDKSLLDIPESSCGINTNGTYIFSLSLSGVVNFWEIAKLEEGKLPDRIIDGHQNHISSITHNKTKNLTFSADTNGKVIVWKGDDNEYVKTLHFFDKKVVSMCNSSDESTLYTLTIDSTLSAFDIDSGKLNFSLKFNGDPRKIVSSKNDVNLLFVLFAKSIHIVSEGTVKSETNLKFEARALEINEKDNEIYIGANDGNIHVRDLSLDAVSTHELHKSEVTCIKLSHDGNFVASGDSMKNVFVWKSSTKEIVNNRFVFHSAKVFAIDWSSDDTNLVSASLDRSVIVWDVPSKSKVKVFSDMDVEVVTAVTFTNAKEFICGGHSCGLRRFMY